MAYLLELKEKVKRVFNKYDTYIVPAVKFLVALVSFLMLNASIGYMTQLKNPVISIMMSILCAFLPNGATIVFLSIFMLLHLYAISAEFALIAFCVILLMYLLYFRFTPKSGYILILTAMMCWLKVPYMIPVAIGLCSSWLAMIPVGFGVVIFYIIKTASEYETVISNQSMAESVQQVSYLVESLIKDRQMIIIAVAMMFTVVLVYCIRRLRINYAWSYAVIAGSIFQFVILVMGEIIFKAKLNVVMVVLGVILGAAVSYFCNIVFFALDFKRTEYVQFEDDDYYYYVKAVPKINVAGEDVKVKQINARKTRKASDISNVRRGSNYSGKSEEDADDDILMSDK